MKIYLIFFFKVDEDLKIFVCPTVLFGTLHLHGLREWISYYEALKVHHIQMWFEPELGDNEELMEMIHDSPTVRAAPW